MLHTFQRKHQTRRFKSVVPKLVRAVTQIKVGIVFLPKIFRSDRSWYRRTSWFWFHITPRRIVYYLRGVIYPQFGSHWFKWTYCVLVSWYWKFGRCTLDKIRIDIDNRAQIIFFTWKKVICCFQEWENVSSWDGNHLLQTYGVARLGFLEQFH